MCDEIDRDFLFLFFNVLHFYWLREANRHYRLRPTFTLRYQITFSDLKSCIERKNTYTNCKCWATEKVSKFKQ